MNILYVGPYRQNNYYGLYSQAIIQSLGSKHNLTIRPIFYSSEDNNNPPPTLAQLESTRYQNYDCLVQHVEVKDILYTNIVNKNMVIPIINNSDDQELLGSKLVDKYLLDSDQYKHIFPESKTELFELEFDFSINRKEIFDIGPLLPMKKLYFVGKYQENIDTILSTIRAFVSLQKDIDPNIALVFFVLNINQNQIATIKEYIKKIYSKFGYKYTIDKIAIVPISMSIKNILSCHNSGDIYLNLNTSPCSSIDRVIARNLDKEVIPSINNNYDNLYYEDNPTTNWCLSYTDKSIANHMINYFKQTDKKQPIKNRKINNIL